MWIYSYGGGVEVGVEYLMTSEFVAEGIGSLLRVRGK